MQAPASLGSPSRLPRVPLLLSTWFWDLTVSLPFLFSSKSHHKGAVCQLCTGHLSLPPSTSASLCPLPAIWSQVPTFSLSLSLCMAAVCGPRGTWAQTWVGCGLAQVLRLLTNKPHSVRGAEASCWGKAKERKSVLKSTGDGSQDKYTQLRELEGWKIPDAEVSLWLPGLPEGRGSGGKERARTG